MIALCDHPWELPYRAIVPWPKIEYHGQLDWVESVYLIENWLEKYVGPHYQRWVWSTWSLHQTDLCAVSFSRSQDNLLFVLRWAQ